MTYSEHPEEYSQDPEKYDEEERKKRPRLSIEVKDNKPFEKIQEKVEGFGIGNIVWVIISIILILFVLDNVLPIVDEISEEILSDYPEEDRESYDGLRKILPLILIAGVIMLVFKLFTVR